MLSDALNEGREYIHENPPQRVNHGRIGAFGSRWAKETRIYWAFFVLQFRIAFKKGKFGRILTPIFMNLLLIALLRVVHEDRTLPPSRNLTVYDPIAGCIGGDRIAPVLCEKAVFGDEGCEEVFVHIKSVIGSRTELNLSLHTDAVEYREQLLRQESNMLGIQIKGQEDVVLDVPQNLYDSMWVKHRDDGLTCRVHQDPECAPEQFVYSCASALEYAALEALKGSSGVIGVKFELFPQSSLYVNGITSSFLVWLIPLYISALFLEVYNFALIELVAEKESKQRDYLIAWGFTPTLHFVSWFVWNGAFGFIVSLFVSAGLCRYVFHSPNAFWFIFFGCLSYTSSLLSLAYMVSRRIDTSKTAASISSLSDLVLNASAISIGRLSNTGFALMFAVIPSVPFYMLLTAVAWAEGKASAAAIVFSVWQCLGLSLTVSVGLMGSAFVLIRGTFLATNGRVKYFSSDSSLRVQVTNLTKQYPLSEKKALNAVTLSVSAGEIVTLIGGNGAGKSTLIGSLTGIVEVDSPEAVVLVEDRVGVCLQDDLVLDPCLTVGDHIDFFAKRLCELSLEEINDLVNIFFDTRGERGDILIQPITTLSGGEKRRFSFMLAYCKILKNPLNSGAAGLLILDEPTTGVDVSGRRLMWEYIRRAAKEFNVGVLLTTHYMDEAEELSDRVVFLERGEVKLTSSVFEFKQKSGWRIRWTKGGDPSCGQKCTEQCFQIPIAENHKLHDILLSLEAQQRQGGIIQNLSVESLSLENLFTETAHRDTNEQPPLSAGISSPLYCSNLDRTIGQSVAVARIRIVSVLFSVGSVFSNVVLPILIVWLSVMVSFQSVLPGSSSPHGGQQISFGTYEFELGKTFSHIFLHNADISYLIVPVIGDISTSTWATALVDEDVFRVLRVDDDGENGESHRLYPNMVDFLAFNANGEDPLFYPFAIDMNTQTVWLNPVAQRAAAGVVNRLLFGGNVNEFSKIKISTSLSKNSFLELLYTTVLRLVGYLVVGFSILMTSAGVSYFDERTSGIKQVAVIQGLRENAYWIGSLGGQFFVNFGLAVALPWICVWALGNCITDVPGGVGYLLMGSVVNVAQIIIFGYLLGQLYGSKEQMLKYNSLLTLLLMESVVIVATMWILRKGGGVLCVFLPLLVPFTTFPAVLSQVVNLQISHCSYLAGTCDWSVEELFGTLFPAIWITLTSGVMFAGFGLLILIRLNRRKNASIAASTWIVDNERRGGVMEDDPSVAVERARVLNSYSCPDDLLFVKLWHYFCPKSKGALADSSEGTPHNQLKWTLQNVTFGVRLNEICCLLGENGAGKSTAINLLLNAKDFIPTGGYTGVAFSKTIGYCPQGHALWNNVSGVEHVRFYLSLVGSSDSGAAISQILNTVGLPIESWNRKVGTYSGGMKRRLAIAIAIVNSPNVIILDEPTSGVDISGKREIWSTLKKLKLTASMLLTTHSMEEADYLSNRLCVLHKGRLVKVGTTNELRTESNNCILQIEFSNGREGYIDDLKNQLERTGFVVQQNQVQLRETSTVQVMHIDLNPSKTAGSYSQLFKLLSKYPLSKFTIKQPSLEDVFINIINKPPSQFKS